MTFLSMLVEAIATHLPKFAWAIHNLFAHPASEVLYQIGYEKLGNKVHDATIPAHAPGTGRG